MRGLWWKTWRETWLTAEIGIPVCLGLAFVADSWVQSLALAEPDIKGQITMHGLREMIALGFFGFVGVLVFVALADAPRSLGLDRAGPFLHTRPHARGKLQGIFIALLASHIALGIGACITYMFLTDLESGRSAIQRLAGDTDGVPLRLGDGVILVWIGAWTAVLGALTGTEKGRGGAWIGLAFLAFGLLQLLPGVLGYADFAGSQRLTLALGVPLLVVLLMPPAGDLRRRRARTGILVVVAFSAAVLSTKHYTRRVSPQEVVRAVAAAEGAGVGGQLRRLHEHRHWSTALQAEAEAVRLALAHPDPRVGDAFAVHRPHLAPARALAVLTRDLGQRAAWERPSTLEPSGHFPTELRVGWPADPAEDPAMFALIDLYRRGETDWSAGKRLRVQRYVGHRLEGMVLGAPTADRAEALVRYIAAWPEWTAGRVPESIVGKVRLGRRLRGYVPVPSWVAEHPWRTDDPHASLAVLERVVPFEPPGMAQEADSLIRTQPNLGLGHFAVLASYLSPEALVAALEARWEAWPPGRRVTFRAADRHAPLLALKWLRQEPLDPGIRGALLRAHLSGESFAGSAYYGNRTDWRGSSTPLDEIVAGRRARLTADLIARIPVTALRTGTDFGSPAVQATALQSALARDLISLLPESPTRLAGARALEKVFGLRYGWDVRRWQEWLETRSTSGVAL